MPGGWNLGALRIWKGLGPMAAVEVLAAWRGSKLGLRSHLVILGLAIVVPVLQGLVGHSGMIIAIGSAGHLRRMPAEEELVRARIADRPAARSVGKHEDVHPLALRAAGLIDGAEQAVREHDAVLARGDVRHGLAIQ